MAMEKLKVSGANKHTPTRVGVRLGFSATLLSLLAACAVGPDYTTPEVAVGTEFQQLSNQQGQEGLRPSQPKTVQKDWWQVFNDTKLAPWLDEVIQRKASLEQAEARYHDAQDAL